MILFAILSTFLNSLATIFWKKSLNYWAPKEIFNLLARASIFFVGLSLFFLWLLDFSWMSIYYILIIVLITIVQNLKTMMNQYIYSIEKISTLMPYTNINKILTIILAFFIFWDISNISFWITLLAVIIIIVFSIDYKSLKVPKIIWLFALWEIVESMLILLIWYVLLSLTWSAYYIMSYMVWIFFVWSIVIQKWQLKKFKTLPKKFYIDRLTACHFWWVWYLLSVVLIKELWVSVSILLSFIWIWITLLFSYIFFKDKPSIKNIILTVIVSALVWIWYILK